MAVIDLVYFAGLCLMLRISYWICSVVGWIISPVNSITKRLYDEDMMTSSGWYDTSFQYEVL